jgi:uncharacterized C2H2 Zn-finger protein
VTLYKRESVETHRRCGECGLVYHREHKEIHDVARRVGFFLGRGFDETAKLG